MGIKQYLIWLKRFRYREGYGVHSPFAYNLITQVIYEKLPYYAYKELDKAGRGLLKNTKINKSRKKALLSTKVNQLLFRLVNYTQPETILEIGTSVGLSAMYLSAAKKNVRMITIDREQKIEKPIANALASLKSMDIVHIHGTVDYDKSFELCRKGIHSHTLCIVEGIHQTKKKMEWWERIKADETVSVTFDLYELGLIFFDRTKTKQNYIINF
ncbi:MAG: hypothetical protein RSA92_02340 [Bacteroidaceae bacterium]